MSLLMRKVCNMLVKRLRLRSPHLDQTDLISVSLGQARGHIHKLVSLTMEMGKRKPMTQMVRKRMKMMTVRRSLIMLTGMTKGLSQLQRNLESSGMGGLYTWIKRLKRKKGGKRKLSREILQSGN